MSVESRGPDRALLAVALLLGIATAAAFWVVGYLPTNDGPDHVFSGWLENHWAQLAELDRERVVLHAQLTAHGFRVLFVPLERWLGWRDALRATESIWAVTFALSVLAFVSAVSPRRRWLGLLGFPAAFQWALYMGFFSFVAASALGFFVLAFAMKRERFSLADSAVLAALLFFTALLHVFPAVLVGLALVAIVLSRRTARADELALLVLAGLPAAAVALLTSLAGQGDAMAIDTSTLASRAALASRVFAVGPAWRLAPFFVLAATGYTTTLARPRTRSRAEVALAIVGALCLIAVIACPLHLPHWQFLSPRFVVLGVVLGLALVELERLGATVERAAKLGIGLFSVAAILWSIGFHRRLEAACAPALAGLDAPLTRTGFTAFLPLRGCFSETPIDDVPYVPKLQPLGKAASLYAVAQGGLANALNGVRELHAFSLIYGPIDQQLFDGEWATRWIDTVLARPPSTPERDRERYTLISRLAEIGATNDQLVIYGRAEHRRLVLDRGYAVDWENDALSLARFVGCPFEVELPGGWAQALVEYGWWPHADPLVRFRSREATQGPTRAKLPRTPCGPIWIRVTTDDGRHCLGADADGRVYAKSAADSSLYRCRASQ